MRSGLPSYTEDPAFLRTIDQDKQRDWQPEELLKLAYTQPALFAPGSSWHYSNTNYILLGLVMEQLTGRTVSQLFQERLFSRLGMQSSVMPAVTDTSMPQPYAHGYHFGTAEETGGASAALPPEQQQSATAGTLQPHDWTDNDPSWGWTAGSVISTADDLAVFVGAPVEGGLLDASMQQRRLASLEPPDPVNTSFGYGYGLMRFRTYYGHNGQIPGYNSWMVRDPKTRTSLIILPGLTSSPDGKAPADDLGLATLEYSPNKRLHSHVHLNPASNPHPKLLVDVENLQRTGTKMLHCPRLRLRHSVAACRHRGVTGSMDPQRWPKTSSAWSVARPPSPGATNGRAPLITQSRGGRTVRPRSASPSVGTVTNGAVKRWEDLMKLRVLGAAALLVSAAVHLIEWFSGVRNQSVGPLFLVNVVAGVVIAVLLLRWRHWIPAFLTLGFGAATLGAFILSTTVGLLGVHSSWQGFYVYAAAVAEIVCIVVGGRLLLQARETGPSAVGSRRHRAA